MFIDNRLFSFNLHCQNQLTIAVVYSVSLMYLFVHCWTVVNFICGPTVYPHIIIFFFYFFKHQITFWKLCYMHKSVNIMIISWLVSLRWLRSIHYSTDSRKRKNWQRRSQFMRLKVMVVSICHSVIFFFKVKLYPPKQIKSWLYFYSESGVCIYTMELRDINYNKNEYVETVGDRWTIISITLLIWKTFLQF